MTGWQDLARFILDEVGDHTAEQRHPTLVEVTDAAEGGQHFRLTFLTDGPDLLGWSAPSACVALGMVATATIEVIEGPVEPAIPLPLDTTTGVRISCVVGRDGGIGWRMRLPNGSELDQAPEEGRLLDCLRRCLGLATPPPPASPGRLQSVLWLTTVLDEARRSSRRLGWREIIELHPVAEAFRSAFDFDVSERHLADLVDLASSTWTWTRLRQDAVSNQWASAVVAGHVADWMDDGMFARWILAELPAPEELVGRIRHVVAPSTARRIAHTVRATA